MFLMVAIYSKPYAMKYFKKLIRNLWKNCRLKGQFYRLKLFIMKTLTKHTGGVPQLAGFYLVPVPNILRMHLPRVHLADATDIVTFEFAEDSVGYTVTPIGSRKQEAFSIVFSGFLAGISEQNTDMLIELAAAEFIIIATDHDAQKYVAGNNNTPFKLKFSQSPGPRIGYSITLEARTTVPLHEASIIEGYYNPEDPIEPPPPPEEGTLHEIGLAGIPEVPPHYLSGSGKYEHNSEATIWAVSDEFFPGYGWMQFVHWMKFVSPGNYDILSSNNTYTFTVTESMTIYAYYESFDPENP